MQDCECIGLKIRQQVNGENVAMDLEEVLMLAGTPKDIVKDCDATSGKGVRLWTVAQYLAPQLRHAFCCSRVMTSRTVWDLLGP